MDKKKPPRRAKLTPRSKVKVEVAPAKAKVTKAAKVAAQPLPQSFAEAYALANPDAQIRNLHLNPNTGVYGSSPYDNLLEARLELERANKQPEPRTLAEKVAANTERIKRENAIKAEKAKRLELASRGQQQLQSWSEQKAQAEREAAQAKPSRLREIADASEAQRARDAAKPQTTLKTIKEEAAKKKALQSYQQRTQSWSEKQAREAIQQAEAQRAYEATYGSGRAGKMPPRQATMESQARRLASGTEAISAAEGRTASRLAGLGRGLRGGAVTALIETVTNPIELGRRSTIYDETGRTWQQHDDDRAQTQGYFDNWQQDAQYRGNGSDATAVHTPLYKQPEVQSEPMQYSIAQQLSNAEPSVNTDDAYLEEMRRKKLAQDIAALIAPTPRQSSYSPGRWAPAPLFREN